MVLVDEADGPMILVFIHTHATVMVVLLLSSIHPSRPHSIDDSESDAVEVAGVFVVH